jgi:shikimate kinase
LHLTELTSAQKALSLVGMPGGGKSTVGRLLARRLNLSFVDSDAAIERRIGCPIRAFFEQEGEARFRDIEAAVVEDLIDTTHGVIATGGGIVLRQSNREALRERTVCLYLRSSPEELFRRLRHDTKRPLLQVSDPLARLRELFGQRDPLYRETAQFIVDTGRPSVPSLVNMILMQLELAGAIDTTQTPPRNDPVAG